MLIRISLALALAMIPALLPAQGPGGPKGPPPRQSGKAGALVDFTGNWVSVVSEDWRWRMVTPLKGDFANIPINQAAQKVGETWDPARDEAQGLQCKAYGAPAIMRVPGRLRISWQDDNTLKMETDAGQQTRLFRFGAQPPSNAEPSWQGFSIARWEAPLPPPGGFGAGLAPRASAPSRTLEVVTSNLRAGYLRKNGIPYSERATVTEYYDLFKEPNGDEWFTVTTVVTDPVYLTVPWVTTTDFKRERDGSKWSPAPCSAR
jgi:hypothetical protein